MQQNLIAEEGGFLKLKDVLQERNVNSIFIIAGRHFFKEGNDEARLSFLSSFKQYVHIKQKTDVTVEEAENCYNDYKKINADAILAIGGGSVIDLAKSTVSGILSRKDTKPLLVAVPTTAGSGSEATQFATIYENKIKASLADQALLPDIAILDPQLTYSLSPIQTAISGIDALSHAIESIWNIYATRDSMLFAEEAITTLLINLPKAVHNPDAGVRKNVLSAAHVAGKAINITRTTGPHAFSYFLTAHFSVPHGQAVALFVPLFFLYNAGISIDNCNHPLGPNPVKDAIRKLYYLLEVEKAEEAFKLIRNFMKELGLATTFAELSINKNQVLPALLSEVNQQRFLNNPVRFNHELLLDLFNKHL